ncbi:MAG: hypothetical protein SGBAC_010627 [Bacillariaceae sp.]
MRDAILRNGLSTQSFLPCRRILEVAWKPHVGIYLPEGEKGVDILIPTFNTANLTFGTMRVQVKKYTNSIIDATKDTVFAKLNVHRCAPVYTLEEKPLSIAYLVQVGSGHMPLLVRLSSLGREPRNTHANAECRQVQIS